MKLSSWRLSNHQMTILVRTDENRRIVMAAPIVQKFRGQHLDNLICWMQRMGTTDIMRLNPIEDAPSQSDGLRNTQAY